MALGGLAGSVAADGLRPGTRRGRAAPAAADADRRATCRPTTSAPSPTIPPTWRSPSGSAASSPSRACCAWRGPRSSAAGAPRPWEQTAVREEMWAHHEPRGAQYMGVNWVGPTIMRHGTPEQQQQHLPPIAGGEVIWCQGFSEPDAGSDLASSRPRPGATATGGGSRARRSGPPTPPWPSGASCWPAPPRSEKKHQGLTIFLVPMDDPAIEVRPIATMLGPHHLNEVFFDDLRVTDADVLGTVGDGWGVVRRCSRSSGSASPATPAASGSSSCAPAALGDAVGRRVRRACAAGGRGCSCTAAGPGCSPTGSWPSRTPGRVAPGDAAVLPDRRHPARPGERRGADGPRGTGSAGRRRRPRFVRAVEDHHRYSVSATIASGSIEMQRILLARVLLAAS